MNTNTAARLTDSVRAKKITDAQKDDETREVQIASLTRLQVRVATDTAVVERYLGALMSGVELPMPVVFEVHDGTHLVADGNHTLDAHQRLGHRAARCRVRRGTRLDAIAFAGLSNGRHGLPLSNADKRKVVTLWFAEPGGKNVTDAVIARRCGVSGRFVGIVREEVGATAERRTNSKGTPMRVGTLNGSGFQRTIDGVPSALQKLYGRGLLGHNVLVDLGARLAEGSANASLNEFVASAEKIAAKAVTGDTHPDLRDRLTAHLRGLLAANRNEEAESEADGEEMFGVAAAAATDPSLTAILKGALDPKSVLGGAAPETPLPPDLLRQHPVLAGLKTFGNLAEAARDVLGRGPKTVRGRSRTKSPTRTAVAVSVFVGGDPYRLRTQNVAVNLGVTTVKVPRAALVEALKSEGDVVEVSTGTVTLTIG